MGKGGPNDMYNDDGSRASYEVWMNWIEDLCFEDRLKEKPQGASKNVRKAYKDG